MIQVLRWEKTGIYKTRKHSQTENQTDWLVHLKSKGKAQIFPYITFDTEQKEHTWHYCK